MKERRHVRVLKMVGAGCASMLLQACGGEGDGSALRAFTPSAPSGGSASGGTTGNGGNGNGNGNGNSGGTVSANFDASAAARHALVGPGQQSSGRLTEVEQIGGAIVRINSYALGDGRAVRDIAGDAAFALGRWQAGTVTSASGADTLTGTDGRAYHYVIYNGLATLPASGSFRCDAGTFTAPSRESGAGPVLGSATGNASLRFDAGGGRVDASIRVDASGVVGDVPASAVIADTASTSTTGNYATNGAGATVTLADAGNGAYALVGSYRAIVGAGSYIGAYRFLCK